MVMRKQYNEGFSAFVENTASFRECPYPQGSDKWKAWRKGWVTAGLLAYGHLGAGSKEIHYGQN